MSAKLGLNPSTPMVEGLNLSPSLQKIDANTGGWRLVRAIAFNKLLSQLIEEA